MSITAISFYWRNDTLSFVTWRSRLATAPDTPTGISNTRSPVHWRSSSPQNKFVPEIVSPLPCSPALVCHTLLIVYFFKELISFIGSLDKCHTSVFNALIFLWGRKCLEIQGPLFFLCKYDFYIHFIVLVQGQTAVQPFTP